MTENNKILSAACFSLALISMLGCSPGSTTYYINPSNGNDDNSGLKEDRAWQTFSRVNQLLLSPGDRVEITSPGSFDQTLMLTGAGTAEDPVKIRFAPGRYDFYPGNACKRKYHISCTNDTPDSTKAIGILLEGAKHFGISGAGAKIFYRGKMIEVCIDSCENISISGLQFDYHRPTVSEFTIVSAGDDYVDMQIHKDSEYKIEEGQITWVGEGWSYHTGLAQELDLETDEVRRMRDPLVGMKFEEMKPFMVRARGEHEMKPGKVYQIRNTLRDCADVFTRRSKNIIWENVRFHFLHGMGLVSQFSENLTYNAVAIAPEENSGRTTAAWADCIHISGCKGKILVQNSIFSGAHDDAINVHGTHLRVVEKVSDKQIKVRFMHKQTYGFMAFHAGDDIEFVDWESLKNYGPNKVTAAELLNSRELLLTLEKSIPGSIKENDVVENVTWCPEVEVRGCTVSRIPTRGFLFTTRRKVLVEYNEFLSTHMSAILVANDARSWYSSGCVRDMTIRNNKFIRCGEPVISIDSENSVKNDSVHENILIQNNEFVLGDTVIVKAKSTKNLTIEGNKIYSGKKLDDRSSILLSDCTDVKTKKNEYLPVSE